MSFLGGLCRYMIVFLTAGAVTMSVLSLLHCEFLTINDDGLFGGNNIIGNNTGNSVGILYADVADNGCKRYDMTDTEDKVAFYSAFIAPGLGTFAIFLLLIEFICCSLPCGRLFISLSYSGAVVCQGLTFWLFNSPFCAAVAPRSSIECSLGRGAIYSMVAWGVYVICSFIVCLTPKPEPMMKRRKDEREKEAELEAVNNGFFTNDVNDTLPEEEPKKKGLFGWTRGSKKTEDDLDDGFEAKEAWRV